MTALTMICSHYSRVLLALAINLLYSEYLYNLSAEEIFPQER